MHVQVKITTHFTV